MHSSRVTFTKTAKSSETSGDSIDRSNTIDVLCAADDSYAMPLAVTLKSACRNLSRGSRIRLFLLTGGIRNDNWRMLEQTFQGQPIDVNVIEPEREIVADLSISHHISHTAYFRLLAAELLPPDVKKVVYLDSDLLIRKDISQLWELPLNDRYCLATVDVACPYVDAKSGCKNFRRAAPYMASLRPIPNYRQLGLDGSHEYFNSGVMVLNLDRWRRENIVDDLLRTLRDNQRFVWCWDQYALNVVFHRQWGRFDPCWNQGAHLFEYPSGDHAPIDRLEWQSAKLDPAIVHFTTEFKPWHFRSDHPALKSSRAELFYQGLDDTAWKNWRPDPIPLTAKQWFNFRMLDLIKKSTISSRKLAVNFSW